MVTLTKEIKGVVINEDDVQVVPIIEEKQTNVKNRNKFNRPYASDKKRSRQNEFAGHKPTFDDFQRKRKERTELKELEGEIKEDLKRRVEQSRADRLARKKQKEINENKNLEYQVITDNKKIRKWSKKAKQQLMKMPAEHLERYLSKNNK